MGLKLFLGVLGLPRVWVREDVYRMLEQEAEKEGLTISEFVERLVQGRRRETS
jgi:predicted CopG family antitoxin